MRVSHEPPIHLQVAYADTSNELYKITGTWKKFAVLCGSFIGLGTTLLFVMAGALGQINAIACGLTALYFGGKAISVVIKTKELVERLDRINKAQIGFLE